MNPKLRGLELRNGVYWQGALQEVGHETRGTGTVAFPGSIMLPKLYSSHQSLVFYNLSS